MHINILLDTTLADSVKAKSCNHRQLPLNMADKDTFSDAAAKDSGTTLITNHNKAIGSGWSANHCITLSLLSMTLTLTVGFIAHLRLTGRIAE